jgi:hypothetical protein
MRFTQATRLACLAIILSVFVAGCGTPGSVLTESVGTIRTGIGTAREQSRLGFDAANRIAREQSIELKLDDQRAVSIAESDFVFAVAKDDIDRWAAAFSALDGYTASLQKLVDPKLAQGAGDAIQGLGEQLQNGKAINANLPSGVAGAFATFGQALIQARAAKKATEVMGSVAPQFTALMTSMAAAIGDNSSGLRATVRTNWATVLSTLRTSFAAAPAKDRDARRRVIQQFLDAVDARDAQLASLEQLQTSLIALGEAHTAAAQGSHSEALFWIERIDGWLDDVKKRTDAIEKTHQEALKADKDKKN